jgi:hypothetical protein
MLAVYADIPSTVFPRHESLHVPDLRRLRICNFEAVLDLRSFDCIVDSYHCRILDDHVAEAEEAEDLQRANVDNE